MVSKKILTYLSWWEKYLRVCPTLISNWTRKETEYLHKNIKKNSTILDVGCGLGNDIKSIASIAKNAVGIDYDLEGVRKAKRNLAKFKNVKIFLEDAKRMHFRNNIFDYAICIGNTFGNLGKDKIKILKEMKRVIKNKGEIVISVYSEKALPVRMEAYKKVAMPIKKIAKGGTVYTKSGLISEQFTRKKLKEIFNKVKLNAKIKELNPISYICVVTKK